MWLRIEHGCVMFISSDHFTLTATWHFCLFSVFVFAGNKKRKEKKGRRRRKGVM
jgi:hypothetical protein